MGRPRLTRDPLVKLTFMVPRDVLALLDQLTAESKEAQPYARRERSDICREALLRGLEQMQADQQPRAVKHSKARTRAQAGKSQNLSSHA